MKSIALNLPTFGFIVGTRAALGVGLGLLLSERVPAERRRRIAAALIGIGAATTVPAAWAVVRSVRRSKDWEKAREKRPGISRDDRLIGAIRFPRKGDDGIVEAVDSLA
jgi:hypothetical protein